MFRVQNFTCLALVLAPVEHPDPYSLNLRLHLILNESFNRSFVLDFSPLLLFILPFGPLIQSHDS